MSQVNAMLFSADQSLTTFALQTHMRCILVAEFLQTQSKFFYPGDTGARGEAGEYC